MDVNKLEVIQLLDYLQEIINTSPKVPMSGKILVSKKEIIEISEEIVNLLPEEFRKAQWLLGEKARIVGEAEASAEALRSERIKQVENQVANHDIVREAKKIADEIIAKAQDDARQIRLGSKMYAAEIIEELSSALVDKKNEYLHHLERDTAALSKKIDSMINAADEELKANVSELKVPSISEEN